MKSRLFTFVTFILALLITGCTSTYVKNDFSSEAEFYDKINKTSGSAEITKVNNTTITAEQQKIEDDSVKFQTDIQSVLFRKSAVPLKDVKKISFTDHFGSNIPVGLFAGMGAGGLISGLFLKMGYDSNSGHHTYGFMTQAVPGMIAGGIIGLITGILAGHEDQFVFENSSSKVNSPDEGLKIYDKGKRFGLKIGYHSGFNYKLQEMDGIDEYYANVRGVAKPGFAASFIYKYPLSSLFSVNGELSFVHTGSEARTSVKVPGNNNYYYISNNSFEKLNIIELAVPARFLFTNLPSSPYILLGPRLDILFPGETGISNFLSYIKTQYNYEGKAVSAEYRKMVFGLTFGGGISTGSLLPWELMIEARLNYDLTPRFEMNYIIPAENNNNAISYIIPNANSRIRYGSSELQLSIGAAIF